MLYRITQRVVTFQTYQIEADSISEAQADIESGTVHPTEEDVNEEEVLRVDRFDPLKGWVAE